MTPCSYPVSIYIQINNNTYIHTFTHVLFIGLGAQWQMEVWLHASRVFVIFRSITLDNSRWNTLLWSSVLPPSGSNKSLWPGFFLCTTVAVSLSLWLEVRGETGCFRFSAAALSSRFFQARSTRYLQVSQIAWGLPSLPQKSLRNRQKCSFFS